MKRTTMIAAALALGAGGALFAGAPFPSFAQSVSSRVATAEQMTTFVIENMTCALCPATVKKAMRQVPGVKSVAVEYESPVPSLRRVEPSMPSGVIVRWWKNR